MPVGGSLWRRAVEFLALFESPTVGVGNDEDSVAKMRGTDVCRRHAVPLRVIPARGQVAENFGHASSNKEPWDVLHERVTRS
jgi:hypothetical protein